MKINNSVKVFSLIIAVLFLFPLISAGLGTFRPGDTVPVRVLSNCSNVDLIEVNGEAINTAMDNLGGQTWSYNYTLPSGSKPGIYSYSWNPNCIDCAKGDCGNSFEVTPDGQQGSLGFFVVIILVLAGLIMLGFSVSDGWFVVFGGLGLIAFGLYSVTNGIAGYRDSLITWGTSITLIGVGAYLAINSSLQMINEN
jgi:hypothetical protein